MAVTSGFFNSHNHDRVYDAEQISSIFDGVILDGVYQGVGDVFKIEPYSEANGTVLVGTGRAWFDHTWTLNDSRFSITLDPPSAFLKRIDAIVIDVDHRDNVRKNDILYIPGTFAEDPVPPTLVKEELHKQYPLAYITIPVGESSVVSAANIQNKVGTSECPIVTGVLEVMNSDMFIQQMNAEFYEWFEGIKDLLDSNTAGKLQNQIDDINHALSKRVPLSTTNIIEKIVNGANNGSSITQVYNSAFGGTASVSTDGINADNLGYMVLPDGKVFFVTYSRVTTDYRKWSLVAKTHLVSANGVSNDESHYIFTMDNDSFYVADSAVEEDYDKDTYLPPFNTLYVDNSSYPAKMVLACCMSRGSLSDHSIIVLNITVQENGTVSYSQTITNDQIPYDSTTNDGVYSIGTLRFAHSTDKHYGIVGHGEWSTAGKKSYRAVSIDNTGIVQLGPIFTTSGVGVSMTMALILANGILYVLNTNDSRTVDKFVLTKDATVASLGLSGPSPCLFHIDPQTLLITKNSTAPDTNSGFDSIQKGTVVSLDGKNLNTSTYNNTTLPSKSVDYMPALNMLDNFSSMTADNIIGTIDGDFDTTYISLSAPSQLDSAQNISIKSNILSDYGIGVSLDSAQTTLGDFSGSYPAKLFYNWQGSLLLNGNTLYVLYTPYSFGNGNGAARFSYDGLYLRLVKATIGD